MERSDCAECRCVGALGSAIVGVHASPGFEIGDGAFDHVADLVDSRIEFFLPVEEFSAGWLTIRGDNPGSKVTLVAKRVVIAMKLAQSSGMYRVGVVGLAR